MVKALVESVHTKRKWMLEEIMQTYSEHFSKSLREDQVTHRGKESTAMRPDSQ